MTLRKKKENNMKTRKLLMTFAVVAVAATTFTAAAGDNFLSPRATGNEVKRVDGVNNDVNLLTDHFTMIMTPRAAGSPGAVGGTSTEVTPVLGCRSMTASPRLIQVCAMTPGMPACKLAGADKP